LATLKRWFRQFIQSRDVRAAEKCITTAIRLGANSQQMADMFFAAATDHRFLDVGHTLDFTNKALEALDELKWEKLRELTELLDKQQRVNEIGQLVYQGGRLDRLTSMLGKLLVREDRNFHSIQMIEGAYRQYSILDNDGNN
jgi:hypothetical protein